MFGVEERAVFCPSELVSSFLRFASPFSLNSVSEFSFGFIYPATFPPLVPRSLLGDCPSALLPPHSGGGSVQSVCVRPDMVLGLSSCVLRWVSVVRQLENSCKGSPLQPCCVACFNSSCPQLLGLGHALPCPVSGLLGVVPRDWHINPEYQHIIGVT